VMQLRRDATKTPETLQATGGPYGEINQIIHLSS
jgi:hypothetical protein